MKPEDHIELCWTIVNKYYKYNTNKLLTIDDLFAHGYLGLIRTCETFNPEKINKHEPIKNGKPNYVKFSHYASWWIRKYIQIAISKFLHSTYIINENEIIFLENKEAEEQITELMSILSDKYKYIIYSYYYQNKTYAQIGDELHLSKERIRQIRVRALEKMLKYANT